MHARQQLDGKILTLLDEFGTMGQEHFSACVHAFSTLFSDRETAIPFAGMNVVLFGDLYQHTPPGANATPLYSKAAAATALEHVSAAVDVNAAKALHGRRMFVACSQSVFQLTGQHRLSQDTSAGAKLYKFSRLFMRKDVTRPEVVELCHALNRKAIHSLTSLVAQNPHVAILRHSIRQDLNFKVAQARKAAKRPTAYLVRAFQALASLSGSSYARLCYLHANYKSPNMHESFCPLSPRRREPRTLGCSLLSGMRRTKCTLRTGD